jgi:uracil-DNA glycosylase
MKIKNLVKQIYSAQFVDSVYSLNTNILPPKAMVFNAFEYCSDPVKVIIIGQDPYHTLGLAHGLAFSVPDHISLPPSLKNIFKEVHQDLGIPLKTTGNLTAWAAQGVLLLNTILTVEAGKPLSHSKLGWEEKTKLLLKELATESNNLVFLCWGNYAKKFAEKIPQKNHLFLYAAHPSPLSANQGNWFGCKHFSKANQFLIDQGKSPINW